MNNDQAIIDNAVRSNAGVWFELHGKIWPKDRSRGLIQPRMNYLQEKTQRVLDKMEADKLPIRLIGLKPRQKGSTTYFGAIDYHFMRRRSSHAVVIGGQYSQTQELWKMLQTYEQNDRFNWGNTGEINSKSGSYTNGSQLKPETAGDALAGISGTYQILHATEVARWSRYGVANAGDVLANILKCVPLIPDTLITIESTAEGNSGAFHQKWIEATDAEKYLSGEAVVPAGGFVRIFASWFEFTDSAIRLTPEQKRDIEKTLDDSEDHTGEKMLIERYGTIDNDGIQHLGNSVKEFDVWEQLAWRRWAIKEECKGDRLIFDRDYPHSWQDAFMKSGNQRFNTTGLSILRKRMSLRTPQYGVLEETKNRTMAFRPTERGESKFIIYEKPMAGRKYILAIDPMTGATQTGGADPDSHGAFVLRAGYWDGTGKWNRPATAARIIPCRWDIDVLADEAWHLARFYGGGLGCMIAIEMNMDRGLTELLKQRGANLYRRQVFNQREHKTTEAYGYLTTPKTRETLIESLAQAIREWDTPDQGIDIWDEHAIEQAENFVVKMNGRSEAAEGFHDDDIFSLGLAHLLIDQATTYMPNRGGYGLPPDLQHLNQTPAGLGSAYS